MLSIRLHKKKEEAVLPSQSVEELISISYVSAIIAKSGHAPNPVSRDFGIDLEIRNIKQHGNKRIDLGTIFALQLKASVNWSLEDDHVVHDLDVDAYNRLVFQRENATTPCVLVLCCLPKDESLWVSVCEDELKIKKCCYYYLVAGPASKNSSSQRIRIPRDQLLTPEAIDCLKEQIFMGQIS